ncbi:MAG: NUDIX domain-containing protein [Actinomycetota bacterium]|nr:NUDIX domain-containing protein [Actinomycetota bacterium]
MRPFLYCPSCASALSKSDDGEGSGCESCGRTWYRHSAPTVGCAIVRNGRALVSMRGSDPFKGRFDVPGGFLAAGEDPIEGLKREIREELGVEIATSVRRCISMAAHTYGAEGDYVLALGFTADVTRGEPSPSDDVAEIRWVGPHDLDDLDFAWDHDRELIRKALSDG